MNFIKFDNAYKFYNFLEIINDMVFFNNKIEFYKKLLIFYSKLSIKFQIIVTKKL
jgi:hypothetical protein